MCSWKFSAPFFLQLQKSLCSIATPLRSTRFAPRGQPLVSNDWVAQLLLFVSVSCFHLLRRNCPPQGVRRQFHSDKWHEPPLLSRRLCVMSNEVSRCCGISVKNERIPRLRSE